MKKIVGIIIAVILVIILLPLPQAEATSGAQTIVNKQLEVIKKTKVSGYKFYKSYPVHLTGGYVPEIAVSSYGFEQGSTTYIDKTLLQIYQYNTKSKTWKVLNSFVQTQEQYDFIYRPLEFVTKGKLLDSKKEQLVVGYWWGSDLAFSPFVYGSSDGKTVKLMLSTGDKAYIDGNAIIKNKELFFVQSLALVEHKYLYKNGKFNRYVGKGSDDRKIAGNAKHLITLEKKNGTFVINGSNKITMKVGESLSFIRKNPNDIGYYNVKGYFDPSFSKGGPLQNYGGYVKATKTGKVKIGMNVDYTVHKIIEINVVK